MPAGSERPTVLGVLHAESPDTGYFGGIVGAAGADFELASFMYAQSPRRAISEYDALIVFGGSPQVDQVAIHPWLVPEKRALGEALAADVPVLGICLGAQLLAEATNGHVGEAQAPRKGWAEVTLCPEARDDPIFRTLPASFHTVVWHAYEFQLPPAAVPLARSTTALQAFRVETKQAWGVQFHPEVTPADMKRWVEVTRERHPDVREADLHKYLADAEQFAPAQEKLARDICGGFLGTVGIMEPEGATEVANNQPVIKSPPSGHSMYTA